MRGPLRFHTYDEVLAATMEKSLDGFPSLMPWPVLVVVRWFVLKKVLRHEPFHRTVAAPGVRAAFSRGVA